MKVTLLLVIVSAVIVVISSEICRDDSDCSHVTCDSTSRLACSHGLCTCLVAVNAGSCFSATCTARADCDSCQCRDSHTERHCFDGHCLCGRGASGPGGPGVGK
ncbi:serine protease inhibitor Cvsi-2-like isoform X1 [Haliotis rubra]|uniref:serine protease inhibitor Cvsi-2-like isoform X1 n=1 Tax=Haliotis rubra TaxID=36100 RepID=UPI001EE53028|nr:serine protease inhibitor Cvsi-2-like isoform X1 [Haliotis rubra]